MSEVSSEAMEAAGRAALEAYEGIPYENDLTGEQVYALLGSAALTAALPYLASHQPARVVPNAEEVARGMWAHEYPHEPWPVEDGPDSNRYRSAYLARGRAVLALFASQPQDGER